MTRWRSVPDAENGEMVEIPERVCPTCKGRGEIWFNRSRDRDPQCDDSVPCPTCGGEGA